MEKLILTATGEEVEVGDVLYNCKKVQYPEMKALMLTDQIPVNEKTIPELIERGIIRKESIKGNSKEVNMDLGFYIAKIAKRLRWKIEKVCNYLNSIDSIMPAAAFSIVLREIAFELDKKYKDHIENSPEIYVISTLDGRITKANKAHIKNYRNFAAFRNVEDAKIACSIVKNILKEMFESGK